MKKKETQVGACLVIPYRKMLRCMKSLRVLFLSVCVLLLWQATLWAQASVKVTLERQNASLNEVLQEASKQTGVDILYNRNLVEGMVVKEIKVTDKDLRAFLDDLLPQFKLTYSFDNNIVVVRKADATTMPERVVVKGHVTDMKGNPLPGVSVILKGTTVGTASNADGDFELPLTRRDDIVLIFSSIGMKRMEHPVKDPNVFLQIKLEEDVTELQEVDVVVNTGYQEIDRRHLTSAVSSVRAEDILNAGMSTIDQALEGRIPDLVLMTNSGEVGATPRIRVRGTSTILGNREPLWVLDGIVLTDPVDIDPEELNDPDYVNIIGNAIAGINPQDIERIDVLKDASATALYGTQAANGVIVVTTKAGHVGKLQIKYNHSSQFTRRPRYTDKNIYVMNSQERVQFSKDLINLHYKFPSNMEMVGYEGAWYDWQNGAITYDEYLEQVKRFETVNTDWFKLLTHDAYSHKHTLSVSGGNEQVRIYGSFGYNRDDGVSNHSYVDRYTVLFKADASFNEKLRVSVNVNGNVQKKDHVPSEIAAIDYAYNTTRALPAYNEDGSLYYHLTQDAYGTTSANSFRYNILNEIDNSSNTYNGTSIMATLTARYNIKPLWNVTLTGSYSYSSTKQETWWGEETNYIARLRNAELEDGPIEGDPECLVPYGGLLTTTNSEAESAMFRLQNNLSVYLDEAQSHMISSALGYEVTTTKNTASTIERPGYFKDRGMQFVALGDALEDFPGLIDYYGEGYQQLTNSLTNKISGYLTLSYSYKYHFTLNVNGRFDASNQFGSRSNEKFLPIWSVSGMANLKDIFAYYQNWLSEARIRVSYGHQGNMIDGQTPNLLIRQGTVSTVYDGEYYATVSSLPNPNLKWEKTAQTNVGFDLSLWDGRLSANGDYYYKKTTDLFTAVNVAPTNGVSSYTMNNGVMINKGGSIQLSGYPIDKKDFRWYMSAYYSVNFNDVRTDVAENYILEDYLGGTAVVNGQSISTFYSYKFMGLNPENGAPMFDDWEDRWHLLVGKDLEKVVTLVLEDSGTREPKFSGNWNNTFVYKNLSLGLNFSYSLGSKVRLFEMYGPIMNGVSAATNVRKEFLDRWKVPGDEKRTVYPSIISPSDPDYSRYTSHYSAADRAVGANSGVPKFATNVWQMYDDSNLRVVSGNYLKLQSLVLRWRMPVNLLKKTPFTQFDISFNTHNCFTISAKELKGQDPTQAGFADAGLSVRPSYTIGLDIAF